MCFTYEVLETFCNLPILAAKPKNSLHRTPHFPMTPHLHHPTAPRSRLFTPLHPCRSMTPCAYRPTAPYLRRTMLPSPTPLTVPHWVCFAPLGTAPELLEVWKQKSDQNCNFFAIGNCRRCPNHGSSPENEAKRPPSASFPLYGRRERASNRKKVAKAPGFLFS